MKYFFSELIGTFILSCSLNFMSDYSNNNQKADLIKIIIGFFIALQFSRKISGGHLNPAVTLLFYIVESEKNKKKMQGYYKQLLFGQIIGGLLSPILSYLIFGHSLVLKISAEANYLGAFIMEMTGAAVFYLLVLFQWNPKQNMTNKDEVISSLVICIGLAGGVSIAGNESGAGLNPAISISQNLVTYFITMRLVSLKYTLIYALAPIAASYLATSLYDFLNEKNPFEDKINAIEEGGVEGYDGGYERKGSEGRLKEYDGVENNMINDAGKEKLLG